MLKGKILKANMLYVPAQILGFMISLAKGLIIPKLLLPEEYGLMVVIFLVIGYSKIANFGILNAFDREYPKMISNPNIGEDVAHYRNSCFTFFLFNSALFSVGAIIFFLINYHHQPMIATGLILVGIGMFLDNINEFIVVVNRAHRNFSLVSANRLLGNLISASLLIIITYFFGIRGAIISVFFANISMLYFYLKAEDKPSLTMNMALAKPIYRLGASLFAVLFLSMTIDTLDKIMVIKTYGLEPAGVYNLTHSISRIIMLLFGSAIYVFYPFVLSEYAKNRDSDKLLSLYEKYALFVFWLAPVFLSGLFVFFHSFIPWYLPAYASAVTFMHFLFLGTFWVIFAQLNDTFLLVVNKQNVIVRNQLLTIFLASIFFIWCYSRSLEIPWIAAFYFIYIMFYGVLSYFSFLRAQSIRFNSGLYLFVKFLMPFLVLSMMCFIMLTQEKSLFPFINNTALKTFLCILIIAMGSTPFIWLLNKKFLVVKELWAILRLKFGYVVREK
ncbi:MAG: oligosaccharide flippase family protein [Candidatus Omnitrophota bacterium]